MRCLKKKQIKLLLITMITLAFATKFLCDFTNEFIIIVFRINSPFTVLFLCFEALGYVEVVNCYLYNVEIISKISSNLLITLLFTCYDWIFWQMAVGFFISLYICSLLFHLKQKNNPHFLCFCRFTLSIFEIELKHKF